MVILPVPLLLWLWRWRWSTHGVLLKVAWGTGHRRHRGWGNWPRPVPVVLSHRRRALSRAPRWRVIKASAAAIEGALTGIVGVPIRVAAEPDKKRAAQ